MTTDRCPGCSAAVTPGAPWCTLCYADLRVPVATPANAQPHGESFADPLGAALAAPPADPLGAPLSDWVAPAQATSSPVLTEAAELPPDPILDAPVAVAAPVARVKPAGWPCLGCGALMPMSDSVCSECGRPFLTADEPAFALPGVGDLRHMDRGQKIMVVVGIALAATVLFVVLSYMLSGVL